MRADLIRQVCRYWQALPSQVLNENAELIFRPMVEQMERVGEGGHGGE